MSMNTKAIGERTEALIMARLIEHGWSVSLPFGDNQRYDMILDDGVSLSRVQCKTGKLVNGTILVTTRSASTNGRRTYDKTQIDEFMVYCPGNGKYYRIPVEEALGQGVTLRVDASKNNQSAGVRMAVDFEF